MKEEPSLTLLERQAHREKAATRYDAAEALFEDICDALERHGCAPQDLPKAVRQGLLKQFIDCNLIDKHDASEIDAFWAGSTQAEERLVRFLLGECRAVGLEL